MSGEYEEEMTGIEEDISDSDSVGDVNDIQNQQQNEIEQNNRTINDLEYGDNYDEYFNNMDQFFNNPENMDVDNVIKHFDNLILSNNSKIERLKNNDMYVMFKIHNNQIHPDFIEDMSKLEQKKKEIIIKFKKVLKKFSIKELKESEIWIEHVELNNNEEPKPHGKAITHDGLVEYIPQIFEINERLYFDKLFKGIDPIIFYKKSLKLANEYIHRRKNDPLATNELTLIQGDAFEEHRRRIWRYFEFVVKGNDEEVVEEYHGGYTIDQFIFWDFDGELKLIAIEEDKSHKIETTQLRNVLLGMGATIYNYLYGDIELKIKKNPSFLYKNRTPHIIIHSFSKMKTLIEETDRLIKVFKDPIIEKFDKFKYTYLSNKSFSSKNKTWFYKSNTKAQRDREREREREHGIQDFFSKYAKDVEIVADIDYIINIIPDKNKKLMYEEYFKNSLIRLWGSKAGPPMDYSEMSKDQLVAEFKGRKLKSHRVVRKGKFVHLPSYRLNKPELIEALKENDRERERENEEQKNDEQ